MKPGEKPQQNPGAMGKQQRSEVRNLDGVTGLKKLGVKDLSYKLVFIANSVHSADSRFGFSYDSQNEEKNAQNLNMFTYQERHTAIRIKNTEDIYTKLATSIAPSVYGHLDVKKGVLL